MEAVACRCCSTAAGGVHLMLESFALPVVVKGISNEHLLFVRDFIIYPAINCEIFF